MKRNWVKYTIWVLISCLVAWMLVLLIAFIYINRNKQQLTDLIRTEIRQKISGRVSFDGLSANLFENFPGISVDLKNVQVSDSQSTDGRNALLAVKHIYIGFGIIDLITGKKSPKYISLSDGTINMFADSAGNKNWDIMRQTDGKKGNVELKKISFNNINAMFADSGKHKFYNIWFHNLKCKIHSSGDKQNFSLTSDAIIRNMSFNTRVGSYLADKKLNADLDFLYDKKSGTLSLQDQSLHINNHSYLVSANFHFGDDPRFTMSVETGSLELAEAASIFPHKTQVKLNQYTLSKPVTGLHVYLSGPMKYLSFPVVSMDFVVSDASISVSTAQFDHCSFKGFFKNVNDSARAPSDFNSVMIFNDVKGEWEKNQFDGKQIFFYNLIHPYIKCGVHFLFKLTQLGDAIASPRLDFNGGDGEAMLQYAGPLTKTDTTYSLEGKVIIKNGDISYNPRNLNFKKTDINLSFQNGDMLVDKMTTEVNDNRIDISGNIKGLMNFFNTDSSKANFQWNIYSPKIDIGGLNSSLHRTVSAKKKKTYASFQKLNDKINQLFDDCNAVLNIQADKVVYQKFSASNVTGKLALNNDRVELTDFSLHHADGIIHVSGEAKDNGRNSDLSLQAKMEAVNIRELFAAFDNFGMESMKSKNINGRFSADINFTSVLDANNNLYKPANKGYVDFILENGKLENFQPLMDIDNNFLKKRNLDDIEFAELKDRLELNGSDVKVNRMEIKSTAVNMYVEGIYSFGDNTDLSIQIPLLKQNKDPNVVPEKKGNDSKGGISVFLRAKNDKDGKLKIGYDLLGRFRKKDGGK